MDGKAGSECRDNQSVVAKDAADAIKKVQARIAKSKSFYDEETKKKIIIVGSSFDPINVTLEAQES